MYILTTIDPNGDGQQTATSWEALTQLLQSVDWRTAKRVIIEYRSDK
jgi:hypothetical protein